MKLKLLVSIAIVHMIFSCKTSEKGHSTTESFPSPDLASKPFHCIDEVSHKFCLERLAPDSNKGRLMGIFAPAEVHFSGTYTLVPLTPEQQEIVNKAVKDRSPRFAKLPGFDKEQFILSELNNNGRPTMAQAMVLHYSLEPGTKSLVTTSFPSGKTLVWRLVTSQGETNQSSQMLMAGDLLRINSNRLRVFGDETYATAPLDKTTCLAAGTLIATPNGDRPIESLKIGEDVFSYDLEQQKIVTAKIIQNFERTSSDLSSMTFSNGANLQITSDHPIYSVTQSDWISSEKFPDGDEVLFLKTGDRLQSVVPTTLIHADWTDRKVKVYNLRVEGLHDYFANGVLVHNR